MLVSSAVGMKEHPEASTSKLLLFGVGESGGFLMLVSAGARLV